MKKRLCQAVVWPLKHRDAFQRLGLKAPQGVLLHGPPGGHATDSHISPIVLLYALGYATSDVCISACKGCDIINTV